MSLVRKLTLKFRVCRLQDSESPGRKFAHTRDTGVQPYAYAEAGFRGSDGICFES